MDESHKLSLMGSLCLDLEQRSRSWLNHRDKVFGNLVNSENFRLNLCKCVAILFKANSSWEEPVKQAGMGFRASDSWGGHPLPWLPKHVIYPASCPQTFSVFKVHLTPTIIGWGDLAGKYHPPRGHLAALRSLFFHLHQGQNWGHSGDLKPHGKFSCSVNFIQWLERRAIFLP